MILLKLTIYEPQNLTIENIFDRSKWKLIASPGG